MSLSRLAALFAVTLAASPALANDRVWSDCRTCHNVTAPNGDVLARGGRSGPILYGIAGRRLAGDGDFRLYSDALRAAGNRGVSWSRENFLAYLADPDQFLRSATGDANARAQMHVQMRQGGEAIFDYLRGLTR